MDCYFGAFELPPNNTYGKSVIVAFHIPELGVRFKAPFDAVDRNHSDFASLLALLEFIDTNQKYFVNRTYHIFGHNQKVINQINGREPSPDSFFPLLQKAQNYRGKYHFDLSWIPSDQNSACNPSF